MGWKNWPYWLKGGIIGVVALTALFLVAILFKSFSSYPNVPALIFINQIFFIQDVIVSIFNVQCGMIPGTILSPPLPVCPDYTFWISFVFVVIVYICVGALVGYVYGNMKNRKKRVV